MSGRRANREAGFTLLELLVGLALFGLLAGLVHGTLRIAGQGVAASERTVREGEILRLTHGFVRRHLAGAEPIAEVRDRRWRLRFEGEPDALSFVTAMPRHLGGGLQALTLRLDPAGEGTLVLEREPYGGPTAGFEGQPGRRVIASGVVALAIDYFGPASPGEASAWHREWREARRLPELVRLRIEPRSGGAWPDLVVPLPADGLRHHANPGTGTAPPAPPAEDPEAG